MADTVTSITHESFCDRIVSSWKNLIFSPIFLIIGTGLLIWNEGNSVAHQRALSEGLKAVTEINALEVDSTFEGKLVHMTGKAIAGTDDVVKDSTFGVTPPRATLKLKRYVEMYQWVESQRSEKKKNLGGSTTTVTTYNYKKQWENTLIDSSRFHERTNHENPSQMKYENAVFEAQSISVGAYELSSAIKGQISWYQRLDLVQNNITTDVTKNATIHDRTFYLGDNDNDPVTNPAVGDIRVSFEEVPQQTISIVAKQVGNTLSKYTTSNGKSILLVESGTQAAKEMFENAKNGKKFETWIIRIGGSIFIFFAFNLILGPLTVFADVIPFFGEMLEAANCCISTFLAFAYCSIVIALSWLVFRPVISILLLVGAGAAIYGVKRYANTRGKNSKDIDDKDEEALPEAQAFVDPNDPPAGKYTEP